MSESRKSGGLPATAKLFDATRQLLRLLSALQPNRALSVFALMTLLLGAALEGVSVALLIPLISVLTGSKGSDDNIVLGKVEWFLPNASRDTHVIVLALAVLLLIALKNSVNFGATSLVARLREAAAFRLRRELLDKALHAPADVLDARTSGDLAAVLLTETMLVLRALDLLTLLVQRAAVTLAYFAAVMVISWQLTLFTIALGGGLAVLAVPLWRRAFVQGQLLSAANGELARRVTEIFGGIRVVRTTNNEQAEADRFDLSNRSQARAEANSVRIGALLQGATETIGVAGAMALIASASRLLLSTGAISVPEFLAFGFGLLRLLPGVNHMYSLQAGIVSHTASIAKAHEWLALPRHPSLAFGSHSMTALKDGIGFENLSFSYSNGHQALNDLSLFVPAGSLLAIIGASGSGKSTLASILLRLREPAAGRITFDGRDFWEFSAAEYHRFVAYVEQEPFLFHATIAENVAYGARDVSRQQIEEVLATVKLDSLVARLPAGIDTMVGERGATLSGGQRQRLAIARALVRSPQLLIMDEPTSALDATTEREVVEAIEAARVGRTAIVIAHRASTIACADQVVELEHGRVLAAQ